MEKAPANKTHRVLSKKAEEFVRGVHFAALATLMKDGSPQVTPLWYAYDDEKFIINTAADRVKYRNVKRDPRVALLIHDGYSYVQVRGEASISKTRNPYDDIRSLAVSYRGREEGERQFREIYSEQKRVTIEIKPEKVYENL
ncbi:MAG: PPOX class F420-dependent oxidoreductase [Thaumarchaeota archaeon]|nr:PPOX class F420-dependent oxidoreductase [Nitrososphaerota archaeon]